MMNIQKTTLQDAFLISPIKHGDHRGFFSETFSLKHFKEHVADVNFVQDNHSLSATVGTLRGLHFQAPPMAQGKLVRVTRGKVIDVIVDIRKGSPTYGQHEGFELSAENWQQLWVPAGFAHAFMTLEPDTEFLYKVTNYYSPKDDGGIRFDDPELGIKWPLPFDKIVTSEKDAKLPLLSELDNPFIYGKNC